MGFLTVYYYLLYLWGNMKLLSICFDSLIEETFVHLIIEVCRWVTEYLKLAITFTRYYANGICREGDACRYLHQGEAGSSLGMSSRIDPSETLCRYYQLGACAYGTRCRFVHAGEVSTSSTNNNSHSTSAASSSATRKSTFTHVNKNGQGTRYGVT